jgi:hypothetical protein
VHDINKRYEYAGRYAEREKTGQASEYQVFTAEHRVIYNYRMVKKQKNLQSLLQASGFTGLHFLVMTALASVPMMVLNGLVRRPDRPDCDDLPSCSDEGQADIMPALQEYSNG